VKRLWASVTADRIVALLFSGGDHNRNDDKCSHRTVDQLAHDIGQHSQPGEPGIGRDPPP
jgi:hypothetical protein